MAHPDQPFFQERLGGRIALVADIDIPGATIASFRAYQIGRHVKQQYDSMKTLSQRVMQFERGAFLF